MNENPCKDCEVRFVGCHSYCDDYKEWKRVFDHEKKQRKKEQEAEGMYIESIHRSIDKQKRRK